MKTEKLFGGLGALLSVLTILLFPFSFIPDSGWIFDVIMLILGIAGSVLLLIALHTYSKFYGDNSIFNNFLIGFILTIIATVFTVGMVGILEFLDESSNSDGSSSSDILSGLLALSTIIVAYVIYIVASYYIRESLKSLGKHTGENLFSLAGDFILIGTVLFIILVGGLILLVGYILLTIAFFKPQAQE